MFFYGMMAAYFFVFPSRAEIKSLSDIMIWLNSGSVFERYHILFNLTEAALKAVRTAWSIVIM